MTGIDYAGIVRSLRKPLKPAKVDEWRDIYVSENDVLLSYFLEDQPQSKTDIEALLKGEKRLEFTQDSESTSDLSELPWYANEMATPGNEMGTLAAYIEVNTVWKAVGYGDQIVIANPSSRTYQYPNGDILPYVHLVGEVSANMPVSTFGFCVGEDNVIFVRNNSYNLLTMLSELLKKDLITIPDDFSEHALGIILSHEEIEGKLKNQAQKLDDIEHELRVERFSRENLEKRGIPLESYLTFQILRTSGEKDKNISIPDLILKEMGY